MNKIKETYLNMFNRNYQRKQFKIILEDQNITINDVICESILPSPYKLINDILNFNENKKIYTKNDLLNLSDKDWKYFNELNNIDNEFTLTIIKCDSNDIINNVNFYVELQGIMCEFVDPNNYLNEYIWISKSIDKNRYSNEDIKILLKHELGHVWTGIFGYSNDSFYDGRTNTDQYRKLNPNNFNFRQKDVFLSMYNGNLKNLQNDFNYIFLKNDGDDGCWELSTHIDEIIELLILDYFEQENKFKSTDLYLQYIISRISGSANLFKDMNILKHYKTKTLYNGLKNIELMLNIINRLFLILTFGSEKTIDYFKNECEKEFGKRKGI